jgi:drug/metabolite transporter (DMT)-like permease
VKTQFPLLVAMLIASCCNALGNALLSIGMKQVGKGAYSGVQFLGATLGNGYAVGGTVLLAIFFGLFAHALSRAELSIVLPITALTYVFSSVLAKILLHEEVSPMRWLGTLIIMVGVAIVIKYSG